MNKALSFQKILLAFCVFIGLLLFVRILFSGRLDYLFLVWNIFLAWIPFFISGLFKSINNISKWKQFFIFCCWLTFFPNALYIITDLIHLELKSAVPKWFDAILLFSSSILGLMMAFISLYRVEKYLYKLFRKRIVTGLIIMILFLGSFGVYLGRFLRWNSWDIISNPFRLILSIGYRIFFPFDHLQTWGITGILTVLFYLLYFSIKKLPGYLSQANI
ncbi:MAG: DUF1361 domain-containing protein [Ferruginibacter sp.]